MICRLISAGVYSGPDNTRISFRQSELELRGLAPPQLTVLDGGGLFNGITLTEAQTNRTLVQGQLSGVKLCAFVDWQCSVQHNVGTWM